MIERTPSATAIPATTLVLVRDEPSFEVLMITRHAKMEFAGGALVFPGGKVDEDDRHPDWQNHVLGWDDHPSDRAHRIAGLREVFEETSLLVGSASGSIYAGRERTREAVSARTMAFRSVIEESGSRPDLNAMALFAHWVTPASMPKRFDTKFYLASPGGDQAVLADGREAVNAEWIAPSEALRLGETKERILGFPTRLNLKLLAEHRCVADAWNATLSRKVVQVTSRVEDRPGGRVLTIDADAGYGLVEEPLTNVVDRGHKI